MQIRKGFLQYPFVVLICGTTLEAASFFIKETTAIRTGNMINQMLDKSTWKLRFIQMFTGWLSNVSAYL